MKILKEVLRKNLTAIFVFAAMTVGNAAVFELYGILTEPLIYTEVLSFFLLTTVLAVDFVREKQRGLERDRTFTAILSEWRSLPEANSLAEEDYQKMIASLGAQMERLTAEADAERQDMLDYFTVWVHEIKTPIAVMRLKLSDDTPEGAVTIQMRDGRLTISDTGIGIAPEDLPRIFEKGYTGINGRLEQKSSGLGLYLAKKAADLIAIPLTVESTVGVGSAFILNLKQKAAEADGTAFLSASGQNCAKNNRTRTLPRIILIPSRRGGGSNGMAFRNSGGNRLYGKAPHG